MNKATVLVNDVHNDPAYLTTFGKTQAELIIPIIADNHEVVGTIDVESHSKNAFQKEDIDFLEDCAAQLTSLW